MSARVLIIENQLPYLELLEEKLHGEYYDVIIVHNTAQALEIINDNPPDIILLGMLMPEMEGAAICKQLKSNPALLYIPIIMVTPVNNPAMRVQGLKAGADDFLIYPSEDLALFARMRSLVRLKILTDELQLRDHTGGQLGSAVETILHISEAKILIIDDNELQGQSIVDHLIPFSHRIDVIGNPDKAMEKAIDGSYDLIIVNTRLQDVDGLRLCSKLKNQEKLRRVPLLVLIEEKQPAMLVKAFDMGINDYAMTPIDGNEITARVTTQIKRKRYQDALQLSYQKSVSMAVTDALTGLYNRRYFDAHYKTLFQKAVTSSKPLTLMILDIDHFKHVNDTYGHLEGDKVIQQIARCLLQNMRLTDLVVRYGGEEFVIILPDTDLSAARNVAERIRLSIAECNIVISREEGILHKTTSIGVASLMEGEEMEDLFRRADKGLYIAKRKGRNRVEIMAAEFYEHY